ncbi:enoyl-CoA hydratase/isomerase family protein [Streptomyces asiaticus]
MTISALKTDTSASVAPVRLERDGGVARIILARPRSGNAFDLELVTSLREAVHQVVHWSTGPEEDRVRAVLLRAEGRNFSVGGDLRAFSAQSRNVGAYVRAVAEAAHDAVLGLAGLDVPVVAALQGAVAGGAVGLALSADLVLAARTAKVRLAYTSVGLTPDCGTSWFLPRAVGEQRALDLVLTNRVLSAADAEGWGLCSRVVDDDLLSSAAEELVRSLASGHARALSRAKLLIRAGHLDELRDHLDCEATFIAEASARPEVLQAMAQFLHRPRTAHT